MRDSRWSNDTLAASVKVRSKCVEAKEEPWLVRGVPRADSDSVSLLMVRGRARCAEAEGGGENMGNATSVSCSSLMLTPLARTVAGACSLSSCIMLRLRCVRVADDPVGDSSGLTEVA